MTYWRNNGDYNTNTNLLLFWPARNLIPLSLLLLGTLCGCVKDELVIPLEGYRNCYYHAPLACRVCEFKGDKWNVLVCEENLDK